MEEDLRNLFEEYTSLPKSPQRTKLGRKIRAEEKKLVEECDYVGIISIFRYLSDYEKDRLFLDLLERHQSSSLFVLAFADSGMHSYGRAYDLETEGCDDALEPLKEDIELIFDTTLCKFLSDHATEDDLRYAYKLSDGASWLECHKLAKRWLLSKKLLVNYGTGSFLSVPFLKNSLFEGSNYILFNKLLIKKFEISGWFVSFFYYFICIFCNH